MQNLFSIGQTHRTRRAPGSHKSATAPTAYVTRHAVSTYRRHVATLLGAAPCGTFGACFQLAVTRSTILNEQEARLALGARGAAQAWAAVSIIAMMAQDAPGSSPWRQEAAVPTLMTRHARSVLVELRRRGLCSQPSCSVVVIVGARRPPSRRAVPRGRCSRPPVRYDWTSAGRECRLLRCWCCV